MNTPRISRTEANRGDPLGGETDWVGLGAVSDEDVVAAARTDPDAPPTTEDDWADAWRPNRTESESITLRLDHDVLDWFRRQGDDDYTARINAALRTFIARAG